MKTSQIFSIGFSLLLVAMITFAAPPIFNPIGTKRAFNSYVFLAEGEDVSFAADATDPDGDKIIIPLFLMTRSEIIAQARLLKWKLSFPNQFYCSVISHFLFL